MTQAQLREPDRKSTSKPGRPRRNAAQVREQILAAATRLFSRYGIEGVNSNQIAREAGVGVGTFYKHFRDKHEIRQFLVLDTLETLRRAVASSQTDPARGIETEVRAFVSGLVAFAASNPDRFCVAFAGDSHHRKIPAPKPGEPGTRAQVGYSSRVTERRLEKLRAAGQLDPALHPAIAARAFVAMQTGVLTWWLEDRSRASEQELVETLVRLHPAVSGAR